LGFEPTLYVEGPLDTGVPEELAADLLATLREALSNAARHAQASRVNIGITVGDGDVRLMVSDDGIGPPEGDFQSGNGLKNMAARAERHGGVMELRRVPQTSGAILEWRVPRP
jgi:signal transduction histidine kinase